MLFRSGAWKIVLSSDEHRFGGGGHQNIEMEYPTKKIGEHGYDDSLELYLISRSALVLKAI